ncbi:hypothetical protein [uncultured Rhodoblastus sp.]|uniref:hypothetical protein n=1 Tax=uncultured Rhodoblastus sp. TaxID=543037 RepID=UPI0025DF0110|nr:hypothetical protein [uncultured Rhodoblastus sp.]
MDESPQTPAALVYENDFSQVLHLKGNSAFLLVTFNALSTKADGKRFWGDDFCRKVGLGAPNEELAWG